jgi:hypothetical protein
MALAGCMSVARLQACSSVHRVLSCGVHCSPRLRRAPRTDSRPHRLASRIFFVNFLFSIYVLQQWPVQCRLRQKLLPSRGHRKPFQLVTFVRPRHLLGDPRYLIRACHLLVDPRYLIRACHLLVDPRYLIRARHLLGDPRYLSRSLMYADLQAACVAETCLPTSPLSLFIASHRADCCAHS